MGNVVSDFERLVALLPPENRENVRKLPIAILSATLRQVAVEKQRKINSIYALQHALNQLVEIKSFEAERPSWGTW